MAKACKQMSENIIVRGVYRKIIYFDFDIKIYFIRRGREKCHDIYRIF